MPHEFMKLGGADHPLTLLPNPKMYIRLYGDSVFFVTVFKCDKGRMAKSAIELDHERNLIGS
jgi:uncharacterized protein YqiB (DUF1249 family)